MGFRIKVTVVMADNCGADMASTSTKSPARKVTKPKTPAPSSSTLVDEQLARYREMRDFSKTAEPSGNSNTQPDEAQPNGTQPDRAQAGEQFPFVIQKHAATRLHYDLRLGLHGVLKSWAVTKGPSYARSDKRLAVQVEDHPMEYGGFEGTIPKGQYGGGTVMLWDEGTWEPIGDPDAALEKGDLKFILHGKKLQGKWVLVRMGGKAAREAKPNWLLIKERDGFEQTAEEPPIVELAPNSVLTGRDLDAIARDGDHVWNSNPPETAPTNALRSAATRFAPARLPGAKEALPGFIAPQLASEAVAPPTGADWLHELKLDGYRIQSHIEKAGGDKKVQVRLFTRSGLDWTHRMPSVARALGGLAVESAIIDGEVVVLDANGQSSFANLQAAFDEGSEHALTYFVFDLLHVNGHNLRKETLTERKELLAKCIDTLPEQDVARYSQHLEGDGGAIFAHACELGAEGIVSKRAGSVYLPGRSKSWIKTKCFRRQEFVVGGFTKPANGTDGVGALLLGYYDDKKLVYAGRVGTGFTQASGRALHKRLEAMRQTETAFADGGPRPAVKGVFWVHPELVAEVQFTTWTSDQLIRQASFKGLREDKKATEVRREVPDVKPASAATSLVGEAATHETATAKTTSRSATSRSAVRVTHPGKVLDPETGLTKQALVDYYLAVADRMLPHISGRPLSLVRCPNGAGKPCFYQKQLGKGMPAGIEGVEIPDAKGDADEIYVTVKTAEGLAGLAQMNVLEIHPWGSTNADLEHPDRIIFDLDPDEAVGWATLCKAALEVKQRLEQLRLDSYVKTTGGKGLHVVAPIRPTLEWEQIKAFTRALTLHMEQDNSQLYISKMTKAARKNKIFVDYLRNDREATAVAPYSSRARLGMTAALPLEWAELKGSKAPRFLIAEFAGWSDRLKKDPWKAMLSSKQEVPKELFP